MTQDAAAILTPGKETKMSGGANWRRKPSWEGARRAGRILIHPQTARPAEGPMTADYRGPKEWMLALNKLSGGGGGRGPPGPTPL